MEFQGESFFFYATLVITALDNVLHSTITYSFQLSLLFVYFDLGFLHRFFVTVFRQILNRQGLLS